MSKDRRGLRKGKRDIRKIGAAIVATMMVVAMVIGLIPNETAKVLAAEMTSNINGFSATMIADPDTSEDNHIFNGTPAEDGKIWTDKSVTTGAIYGVTSKENNFYVALSALAQTYNTVETGMSAEQKNVAYDVVFVLDFSGSMNYYTGSVTRAQAMVDALNPSIATLMENKNSRIAVVGYSGSNVGTSSATTLLSLDHYGTTTKNSENENLYFEYTNNQYIRTVDGVTDGNGNEIETASKRVNGGTPTQRGIYRGMDVLQSTEKPNDNIIRIPIMVLLTDGAAGSARSTYRTLTGGTFYEGDANNGNDDAEVGAYTVLTANYAKDTIDEEYRSRYDYTGIFKSNEEVTKFYTIGLGITDNSWTHFMLDPSNNNASGNIVRDMKEIIEEDSSYGSAYAYSDMYKGGENMTADDLSKAFAEIVQGLQVKSQITTSVNDPVTTETTGSATGSNVVFTDYLGYKMELKGDYQYLRYKGVNYRFDKQSDNTYKFSGYDQKGNVVTGPVITKNGTTYTLADVTFEAVWKDEEYNNQKGYWVITWSFPSALLPTYSRLNDYDNTDLEPIRMLYEVGLEKDVNLKEDSLKIDANGGLVSITNKPVAEYVFHTNLYDYSMPQAMTWSEYTPAKDNPYYYETGYTTDKQHAGTEKEYIRLDMNATTTKLQEVKATADISLSNIQAHVWDGEATFNYNNQTYIVDLSGDRNDGAIWTGEVSVPVVGATEEGKEVTANIAIYIEATYDDGWSWNDDLNISAVSIPMAAEQGLPVSLNSAKTTASVNGLVISVWDEEHTVSTEEVVSIYMELKGDATNGYYVEDENGNKIEVTKDGDDYKVVLGDDTYYSHSYYKYADGTQSYVDKELGKGTVAKSLVGQFKIQQPESNSDKITADNYGEIFTYLASNGATFKATRVILKDGTVLGEAVDSTYPIDIVDGTINVCVDGIKNGQTDVNGNPMKVHFDFIVEEQTSTDGSKRYVLLDCYYWDSGDTYSVDVVASETPEIDEENKIYAYDISYTIESTHASGTGNVTKTDPHFFYSHLGDEGEHKGQMQARLGNNGLLAVDVSTAYDKAIKVEKEWYDRLGNEIALDSGALNGVTITAGLYQTYEYENAKGQLVTNGENPFITVELNKGNNFSHTWEQGTLPKYLVDESGDYIIDSRTNDRVEIKYEVDEVSGADGWTLAHVLEAETADVHTFTMQNVPLVEFSPSVRKIWKDNESYGYKIRIQLLADGEPVVEEEKIDSEHIVVATLTQTNADASGELAVKFGDIDLGKQEVVAKTSADYVFTYDNNNQGLGGAVGSGTHADSVEVTITISNNGDSKLSIGQAVVTYNFTVKENNVERKDSVSLTTFRKSDPVTSGDTVTTTYIMSYKDTQKAEVILDGETDNWFNKLDKWNLPMLKKDDTTGEYKAIAYSIRETILIPYENGMETDVVEIVNLGGVDYIACEPDENGVIVVPQADGSYRIFQSTITHTADYQFTVENDEVLTTVTAEKVWVDNNNAYETRPANITFKLIADGQEQVGKEEIITPDSEGNWASVEWTKLPTYSVSKETKIVGEQEETVYTTKEIAYTVEEVMGTLPNDSHEYKTEIVEDSETKNHFVVTNSLYADPMSMGVEKIWEDNNNAYQTRLENLYMVLYRGFVGESALEMVPGADVVVLNSDKDWKAANVWTNLPRYNAEGKQYIYSVKEYESLTQRSTDGVSGYEIVESESGLDETTGVYQITNRLTDGTISKTVTKVWKDAAADARPESITVELTGTTSKGIVDLDPTTDAKTLTMTLTGTSTTPWSYTWDNLPEYSNEEKIDYTIEETKVGATEVVNGVADGAGLDYAVSVQDDGVGNTFTVTNTLTGTTTVTVKKEWKDTPTEYVIPTVTFDVYNRYGGKVEDVTLTVTKDKLTDSVTLPKYNANGEEFYYTIEEQAIADGENYKINSSVTGGKTDAGVFEYEAVNTYVPLKRNIEGTKTWVGVKGANIPTEITLELSRKVGNGTAEVVSQTPVWEKNGETWTYKYENLPVYENNDESKPYVYSIKETAVGGEAVTNGKAGDYEVTVDGFNITNKLTGTVQLTGTKTWVNVSSEDNVPDTIKVQLFRKVGTGTEEAVKDNSNNIVITVNKADQTDKMVWSYNFNSYTLAKYDANGNAYEYFVKETEVTAGNDKETASYSSETAVTGTVGDYDIALDGMNITNTLKLGDKKVYNTELPFTKLWENEDGSKLTTNLPDSITVQLLQDGNALNPDKTATLTSANADASDASKWTGKFENLRTYKDNGISKYKYTVNETKIESVVVVQNKAGAYTVSINEAGNVITNTLVGETTDITIKKTWKGVTGDNIPSIKVQLLQSGTVVKEETLSKDTTDLVVSGNTWTYTFKDLAKYQADGVLEHVYTVKEIEIGGVAVSETTGKAGDYQSTIEASKPLEITNELTGTVDKIEGKKIWKDVSKVTERPASITVDLYRNIEGGTAQWVESKVVNGTQENAEWTFEFNKDGAGYPKYDSDGNEYTYFVKEKNESNGMITIGNNDYKVAYGTDSNIHTITNTLFDEYTPDGPNPNPIKVTKIWKDDNNSQGIRPTSVEMTLVQNGDLDKITLSASNKVGANENEWADTFTGTYPMYDAEGTLIVYSVKESTIADYTLTKNEGDAANGFTLTNVYTPGEMTITVNKTWVDNSNALGERPEKLTLNLLQDGKLYGTIELTASAGDAWTVTKKVPSTNADGILYKYTVEEPNSALTGDYVKTSEDGLNVTNTLQGTLHVNGTKTWKNIDKKNLPESVTVELWRKAGNAEAVQMKDAKDEVMEITTDANKDWKYDFGELPKYDENGALYTYIVKETKIGGTPISETDYQVSNGANYDLVNELKDIKIAIRGTKTWVDNNNQYKMRPESITVNLLRDGKKVASVQVKAATDGTWTYEFKDLPKYDMSNGNIYTYSVEEENVENYNSKVNGFDITNTLDESKIPTPEKPVEPTAPKTSDSGTTLGYVATALFAFAAVVTAFFKRRRVAR